MNHRVAVTGMAGISPVGNDWPTVQRQLLSYRNAVKRMPEWAEYDGLNTQLAAPAAEFCLSPRFTTKTTRTMGRVALMATRATELALTDAGLLDDPVLKSGSMGIAFGSSAGTPRVICDFVKMLDQKSTRGINATTYIKMMAHTAPVNIGVFFGVTGRIITTSSACTSGSQGIGYAYEAIRSGRQRAMIAGGAEEYTDINRSGVRHHFDVGCRIDCAGDFWSSVDEISNSGNGRRSKAIPIEPLEDGIVKQPAVLSAQAPSRASPIAPLFPLYRLFFREPRGEAENSAAGVQAACLNRRTRPIRVFASAAL